MKRLQLETHFCVELTLCISSANELGSGEKLSVLLLLLGDAVAAVDVAQGLAVFVGEAGVAAVDGAHGVEVLAHTRATTNVVLNCFFVLVAASLGAEAASNHANDVELKRKAINQ